MSAIVTPEMVKSGATVLARAGEASPDNLAEMIYRAMAAAAPADDSSPHIVELERQLFEAAELAQVQRERIRATDVLLEALRARVAELEETYLGRTPRPH